MAGMPLFAQSGIDFFWFHGISAGMGKKRFFLAREVVLGGCFCAFLFFFCVFCALALNFFRFFVGAGMSKTGNSRSVFARGDRTRDPHVVPHGFRMGSAWVLQRVPQGFRRGSQRGGGGLIAPGSQVSGLSQVVDLNTTKHEAHWAGFEPKTNPPPKETRKTKKEEEEKNKNTKTTIRELNPRPPETTARLLEHNRRRQDGPVVLGFGSNPAQCASWCFVLVVFSIVFLACRPSPPFLSLL